jgi:hypothetical protein
MVEGEIIAGKHFPGSKLKHTLTELLDRYVQEIMPRKTLETQRWSWWRAHTAAAVYLIQASYKVP